MLSEFLKKLFHWYLETTLELVKIKAVELYVKAVRLGRNVFIASLVLRCLLLLMAAGFVLLHIALLIYLPIDMKYKSLGLLVLSAIYFVVPLIVLIILCSQRFWMRTSKASELVKNAARKR